MPYHKHYVIRSFPLCGVKVLHPERMISLDRQLWRPPKQKTKKNGMYPGCLAHVVSGMFYSVASNLRQPNLYIYAYKLFERIEFLIPTWVTPQYRATSQKKNMCVCSTNLGFSGGKICACVRLIVVSVGGRQTAIVVARYDSMIPGT